MTVIVLLDSKSRITVCPPLTDQPIAASSQPPLSHNTEHILQGRARVIAQYVGKPRLDAMLCIYLDQVQLLEDALWQLATLRTIETGEGVQLDGIGDIVGQERQGLSDDDYKPLLRARVKANNSEGTAPDVIAVAIAALNDPGPGEVYHQATPPAAFELILTNPPSFDEKILNRLVRDATMAGVRSILIVPLTVLANQFVFEDGANDNVFSVDTGFESATTPGTGDGELARGMDEQTG